MSAIRLNPTGKGALKASVVIGGNSDSTAVSGTKPRKSRFAADVLKLASGTTFSQVLGVLASPILTRLYTPEAWGLWALFVSLTGITAVIACMRYELSIVLPTEDKEAANLLAVSLSSAILFSLLTVPLVVFGKGHLLNWLNAPGLSPYLWLIPFMVFIYGVYSAFNYWNSRTRRYGTLAIASGTNSLTTTAGKLSLGYAGFATAGTMIVATVAGQVLALTLVIWRTLKDSPRELLGSVCWERMRKGIMLYKEFPLFNTAAALMNTMSNQLAPLMLAVYFSSAIVGLFALGHRLLSMPANLIGGAIGQVFFQRAAAAKHDGTLPVVVRTTFTKLVVWGLFPILLVMVAGKDIFSVIFGSRWSSAGIYAQILAPWLMFQFISAPLSTLLAVLDMLRKNLLINIILLLTRIGSIVVGGFFNSIVIALVLFSITGSGVYLALCVFLLKKSKVTSAMLLRDMWPLGIIAVIALLPVVFLKVLNTAPLVVMITGCLSFLFYYTILCLRDQELRGLVIGFVRRTGAAMQ